MKYYKTRRCPTCNRELFYSCSSSFCLARSRNAECRSCATIKYADKQNNFKILLNNSYESLYWIGFILADGHIENNKRLQIILALKDTEHLKKFADYTSSKITVKKQCHVSGMDTISIGKLADDFNIQGNKTHYPPEIRVFEILDEKQLLAVFTGFIDGDGCIKNLHKRKDFSLTIKCHSSWFEILKFFKSKFFMNTGTEKINNRGYAYISTGNTKVLKELKRKILNLNIPFLKRKWDIIDLQYVSKYENSKNRLDIVKEKLHMGWNQKDIAELLKISSGGLSQIIKRNNLRNY